jgi:undecaprenyl-diphosphatase
MAMTAHQARRGVSGGEAGPGEESRPERNWTTVWLGLAGVSYALFIALTVLIYQHVAFAFDQAWLATARSWTQLTGMWQLLSAAANYPLIAIGVGIVLWLFWKGRRREAILVIVVLAACTAGSEAVKQLVARERPLGTDPNIPGVVYSYPSGHVLEAATIFGIISILLWRGHSPSWARNAVAVASALFVVLVGVARIALAEHYPTDVVAGVLAGIGDLGLFAALSPHREEQGTTQRVTKRPLEEPPG